MSCSPVKFFDGFAAVDQLTCGCQVLPERGVSFAVLPRILRLLLLQHEHVPSFSVPIFANGFSRKSIQRDVRGVQTAEMPIQRDLRSSDQSNCRRVRFEILEIGGIEL